MLTVSKWTLPFYAQVCREGEGGGGGGNAGGGDVWHKGIEPDTVGFWQNKGLDISDPKALTLKLTEQYRAAEKHIGAPADRIIRLPERPDDAAAWQGVYERLGTPKEAKEYELGGIKFSDGKELEASFLDSMRRELHTAHVPKDAAPGIVKAVVKYMEDTTAAESAIRASKANEEKETLQKNWGTSFDFNHLKAIEGARRLGITPEAVKLMEGQVGYSAVMEAMRKIGVGTTEATFVERGTGGQGTPPTREGCVARKNELMADAEWTKRYLAGGVKEGQEMKSLLMMIEGEAA
jgi:hypothetical protein